MARKGRFARLPRAAPNLTSVIVGLQREMISLDDRNIENAWKTGASYKGHKVTDAEIVAHFQERMKGLDPNDPTYDYYRQVVQNYQFTTAESKMTLAYAQHSVGEGAMASFYRHWAHKLPKDSEAYRAMLRSAAQYLDIARNRGRSGAAAAKAKAYAAALDDNYQRHGKPYDDVYVTLTRAAQRAGILDKNNDTIFNLRSGAGPGVGGEYDQNAFMNLFTLITTDPRYADLRRQMQARNGGKDLSYEGFLKYGKGKMASLKANIAIAAKFGDKDGVKGWRGAYKDFLKFQTATKDIPAVAAYNTAKHDFADRLSDPTANPWEVLDAGGDFADILKAVDGVLGDETDRGAIKHEMDALTGETTGIQPTGKVLSDTNTDKSSTDDTQSTAIAIHNARVRTQALQNGEGVLEQVPDRNGNPIWNVRDITTTDNANAGTVIWADVGNGHTAPVWVAYTPVVVQAGNAQDPNTGKLTNELKPKSGSDTQIGVSYTYEGKTYWGIYADKGKLTWYGDTPFQNEVNGAPVVLKRSADGKSWVVQMAVPGTGTGAGAPTFDPRSVLNPAKIDPDKQNTLRYGDAQSAYSLSDEVGQRSTANMDTDMLGNYLRTRHPGGEGSTWTDPVTGQTYKDPSGVLAQTEEFRRLNDIGQKAKTYLSDPGGQERDAAIGVGMTPFPALAPGDTRAEAARTFALANPGPPPRFKLDLVTGERVPFDSGLPEGTGVAASASGTALTPDELSVAHQRALTLMPQPVQTGDTVRGAVIPPLKVPTYEGFNRLGNMVPSIKLPPSDRAAYLNTVPPVPASPYIPPKPAVLPPPPLPPDREPKVLPPVPQVIPGVDDEPPGNPRYGPVPL